MVASVSSTPFTSFFASSVAAAIFSISCDFVICTAIFVSHGLIRDTDSIWESSAETGQMLRSAQLVGVLGHPHRAQSQAASFDYGLCSDCCFFTRQRQIHARRRILFFEQLRIRLRG